MKLFTRYNLTWLYKWFNGGDNEVDWIRRQSNVSLFRKMAHNPIIVGLICARIYPVQAEIND